MIIHTALSTMLALVWSIQLVRTIHAERDSMNLQVGEEGLYSTSMNPLQYEEGRYGVGLDVFSSLVRFYPGKCSA